MQVFAKRHSFSYTAAILMTLANQSNLLSSLLKQVSRSFYLTLRVLPPEIRPQISLAYLLARASDTIADAEGTARRERIAILRELSEGHVSAQLANGQMGVAEATPSERELLRRLPSALDLLGKFSADDQQRIWDLLHIIISGQIFDLERFPEGQLTALADDTELDRYTYMVAGCVGEFWTKMCRAHLGEMECWSRGEMEEWGVRFGKGLQLVNVLRDMPKDLRIGRCYLPVKDPQRLLQPEKFSEIQPEYNRWLDTACAHLDAGWQYTLRIPPGRLRLACVWPVWIGLETIARLRHGNPLAPNRRIKVSRGEVYRLMARSLITCCSDRALNRRYEILVARASR